MGLLFRNGSIVNAGGAVQGDLLVEGQTITQLGLDLPTEGHTVVDCSGLLLLPGGIDAHVHLDLPLTATASNDDYASGGMAAAFGGTTTVIDFAIQPKGGSLADGLRLWQQKAQIATVDYNFHMTITDPRPEVLDEIPTMLDAGIRTIKVLMAYKGSFMIDDEALFRIMQVCARHNMLLLAHAENGHAEYEIRQSILQAGGTAPRFHADSRPWQIEAEATERVLTFAELTGCPLYIVHMTNAGSVAALRRAQARLRWRGLPLLGETCIQYLHLTADQHLDQPDFEGGKFICSPPIRTADDHHALWDALLDGTLSVISTDHCPFWFAGGVGPWQAWAQTHDNHHWGAYEAQDASYRRPGKELGADDFSKVPNGLPGIEDRLLVAWHLGVNSGRLSPAQFVALTSTNPAQIFGMYPRKGALLPGADADLVLWDPQAEHTISAATHHMRTDYNCYEGLTVRGAPQAVYLRGRQLVENRKIWRGVNGFGTSVPMGRLYI